MAPPYAVSADGRSVLATVAVGDLFRLVSVSLDGHEVRGLLTVTTRPSSISTGPAGSYYVCLSESTLEVLRFPVTGGVPERLGSARGALSSPAHAPGRTRPPPRPRRRPPPALPEERLRRDAPARRHLRPDGAAGRDARRHPRRLPRRSLRARLRRSSSHRSRRAASCGGCPAPRESSRRTSRPRPTARTVYYPDRGNVWAIDVDGGTPPRKLGAGHGVAAFPDGKELLVQRNGMNGVDLFRVPVTGGHELRIPLQGDLRLAPVPLSGRAVGPGRQDRRHRRRPQLVALGPGLPRPRHRRRRADPGRLRRRRPVLRLGRRREPRRPRRQPPHRALALPRAPLSALPSASAGEGSGPSCPCPRRRP